MRAADPAELLDNPHRPLQLEQPTLRRANLMLDQLA
jgi:hypothetical protein